MGLVSSPYFNVKIYKILTGDARWNQSIFILSFSRKQGKLLIQRSSKRLREKLEDSNPVVTVSQTIYS